MPWIVKNMNASLRFCLTVLNLAGFLTPVIPDGRKRYIYEVYCWTFFMYVVGSYIIAQTVAIFEIWGDLELMTSASFLLFTNLALSTKIINLMLRRRAINAIIKKAEEELRAEERTLGIEIIESCDERTTKSLYLYIWLTVVTVVGWAASAEKNQLPLRAWYPYNTSNSPAYELTYAYQTSALTIAALVNICLDTLVTSMVAVCRCRLKLIGLSLKTCCDNITVTKETIFDQEAEKIIHKRLVDCVLRHEAALDTASKIEQYFTRPILAQFTVSVIIICVTAYQLAIVVHNGNWVRIISMVAYLLCMMLQVFLYCFQGNQLLEESGEISDAAYSCPWYMCSVKIRRTLLIIMLRTRRVPKLTAGGFTTLSLSCFTSIIKASYTFFTVLQQVEDRN